MSTNLWDKITANIPEDTSRKVSKGFDITDQIHLLLKRKGWTQKQLAKELGKSASEISKWLAPGHNFTVGTISKLEAVLEGDILQTPLRHKAVISVSEKETVDDRYQVLIELAESFAVSEKEAGSDIEVRSATKLSPGNSVRKDTASKALGVKRSQALVKKGKGEATRDGKKKTGKNQQFLKK